MSLRLPAELSPGAGLRSVLLALARQARRDLEKMLERPEERIHSLRTGMKKYRSLLRLAWKELPKKVRRALLERVAFLKDGMAVSRDDTVILKTVRRVLGSEAVERLGVKCPHEEKEVEVPSSLLVTAGELIALTETLDLSDLDARNLEKRFLHSLKQARKGMKAARRSQNADDFHRWRKQVKDIWYQSVALGKRDKGTDALSTPARKLSEILGNEHDLTIVLSMAKNLTSSDCASLKKAQRRLRIAAVTLSREIRA